MSYKIVDEIISETLLKPLDKLVLISLGKHADNTTRIAWPSVGTIACQSSLDERTVQRRLRYLESIGILIDVTEYPGNEPGTRKRSTKYGGRRFTTHYRIVDQEEIAVIALRHFTPPKRVKKPRLVDVLNPVC